MHPARRPVLPPAPIAVGLAAACGGAHAASGSQHSVADVRSALRAIIPAMEAGIAKEGGDPTLVVHHAEAGNVVVFTAASRPTASDARLLARIRRLVAYLRTH
jgi:hypothetical protein